MKKPKLTTDNCQLKTKTPGVIILGAHIQALGICRVLGHHGIPIAVLDGSKYNLAHHSRYCSKFIQVEDSKLLSRLLSVGFTGSYNGWLLMPTNDRHVKLLSENKEELSRFYKVVVDDWEKVRIFYHKSLSYPMIERLDIPAPKTIVTESLDQLEQLADSMLFPVIIKPSVMVDFYSLFKKKAILCESKALLIKEMRRVLEFLSFSDILIQEVIPGDSYNQYSVGLFAWEGEIKAHVTARRARQHPIDFGNATTFAETVQLPLIEEYASAIMQDIKYSGLAEVEFKYDHRDGQYKFLEVNPRTWKWHTLANYAKIPLLETVYMHYTGEFLTGTGEYQQAYWQDIVTDIPTLLTMLRHRIPIRSKWLSKYQAVACASDIIPFIMQLLYLPYLFATRR